MVLLIVDLKNPEVAALQALRILPFPANVYLPTAAQVFQDAILLTPVLTHFRNAKLTRQHVTDLFSTLSHIHARNYVHRDMRCDNIMKDIQHAYIIDFGYAHVQTANPIAFAGAVRTASNRVLGELLANRNFPYTPQDDIESLVKV
jgi:serine/threonine protein kinase